MKKVALVALVVVVLAGAVGCGGPYKLSRQFDDWMNQNYVDSPWIWGNVIVNGLAMWVHGLVAWVDSISLNVIDFWGTSAWPFGKQGYGTAFTHKAPTIPAKK